MKANTKKATPKTPKEPESKVFRLVEMSDAITESVANAKHVMQQETDLVELAKSSKNPEFNDFIKESEENINNMSKQVMTLEARKSLLDIIVEKCRQSKELEEFANMLLNALGVFEAK